MTAEDLRAQQFAVEQFQETRACAVSPWAKSSALAGLYLLSGLLVDLAFLPSSTEELLHTPVRSPSENRRSYTARGEKPHKLCLHLLECKRPNLLEGIHPKGSAHPRAVGQESSKGRLFKEAKY